MTVPFLLVAFGICAAPPAFGAGNSAAPGKAGNPWDLKSVLASTAALVECDVTNITETYDAANGPRTIVTCANVAALEGVAPAGELQLSFFGGSLPDGKHIESTSVPKLMRGVHYALFLDASSWFWSPVISKMALRVEQVSGTEALLNEAGQVLTAIAPDGLHFSPESIHAPPAGTPAPGTDRFTAAPLAAGAKVSGSVINRKALAAAVHAALGNAGLAMTPSFARAPAAGRSWNRTDVSTAP